MKVIKEIQWDMGHRVTNHHSQCKNLHGHRYRAEICVEGDLVNIEGVSDEGMVVDFGDIKKLATKYVHDVLDHGFIVWDKDKILMKFFKENADQKHIIVPFVPTAENIAVWIFNQLDRRIKDKYKTGVRLYSVKVWETPTSCAVSLRKDVEKLKKTMSQKVYKPAQEDLERIKLHPDKLKVSGDGVFATFQGEGITAGLPSVFLRLHYCNLSCEFCDTKYTWDPNKQEFWKEPENWSYEETVTRIVNAWESAFPHRKEKRLVVTGGEPLLQQRKIARLLQELPGWQVEIETNGTIMPISELHTCQFNCSPKLANSGNALSRRYKPEVLRVINGLSKSQFKFVITRLSDLDEIDKIVEECDLDTKKILLMPEGHTKEEVEAHLNVIKEAAKIRDWKITLRNQLIWFGPKRGT